MRRIRDANDTVVACVNADGWVMLGPDGAGEPVGLVQPNGECFGDTMATERLGYVDSEGHIYDDRYELVGRVDQYNRVFEEPEQRLVGEVDEAVDATALLLIVGRRMPEVLELPEPPPEEPAEASLMEEALDQAEEVKYPHVRRDFTRRPNPDGR